ncbi:HAD hydrolase-like protein [Psychrobacillus sp. FJAT-51614]|uniref:Nucleotidase n=1 Tax=Psychrobacillus mangrovi TaxID=3117745 RepID=A0ABU8F737_9BACI
MKFGFDIDDTLINLREHAFHLYNKKLNQNIALEVFHELKTVEIHEAFGMEKEAGNAMWISLLEEIYFTDCPAFEGAIRTLQQLKIDGHEIFYITSRPKKYCMQTREWMKAQGFPVEDEHFFCGMQDDEKIATINDLELDYYFDDKPAVLETLNDVTTKVYIMNQSYNQHVNLPRLYQWSELKEIMK